MAGRKSFLFRVDPQMLEALRRWADDDLRSVNGQLEFLLRRALAEAGRLPKPKRTSRGRRDASPGDKPEPPG